MRAVNTQKINRPSCPLTEKKSIPFWKSKVHICVFQVYTFENGL